MSTRMKIAVVGCAFSVCVVVVFRRFFEFGGPQDNFVSAEDDERYLSLERTYAFLCLEAEMCAQTMWKLSDYYKESCGSEGVIDESDMLVGDYFRKYVVAAITAPTLRELNTVFMRVAHGHSVEIQDPEDVMRVIGSQLEKFGINPQELRTHAQREFQRAARLATESRQ